MRNRFSLTAVMALCVVLPGRVAQASEPSPALVANFTRVVQPLLFNRCGTGCHGGPDAGSFHLIRRDFTGRITREITLANIEALMAACGPERSPAPLIATISGRHPKSATSPRKLAEPLSPRERAILEGWLTAAFAADAAAATQAAAGQPANRFRQLLDNAANPPPLPPPLPPQGVILK
jgi:hypothetical protein